MDLVKMPQPAPTAAGPPAQLLDVQLVIEVPAVQLLKNLPERMMPALGRIYELAPSLQAPPSKPSLQFRVPSKLLVDFLHVPGRASSKHLAGEQDRDRLQHSTRCMTAVVADAYRPPLPFLPDRVSETHVGVKGGNHFRLPKRPEEVAQNLTANPAKLVGGPP